MEFLEENNIVLPGSRFDHLEREMATLFQGRDLPHDYPSQYHFSAREGLQERLSERKQFGNTILEHYTGAEMVLEYGGHSEGLVLGQDDYFPL